MKSLLFVFLSSACLAGTEPEDSPLYARSRFDAFTRMSARDQLAAASNPTTAPLKPAALLLVENKHWYPAGDWTAPVVASNTTPGRPRPSDLTYGVTCAMPTSACASCIATRCGGGATCVLTCLDPSPTCLVVTCNGAPSCSGPTCTPPPTCVIATCTGQSTCQTATCIGTCVPAQCPTWLSSVTMPQPGQLQLSFNSSAQLKYTLEFCTNVSTGFWAEAGSTNGTGGLITLCHTNGAPLSLYRLLISQL